MLRQVKEVLQHSANKLGVSVTRYPSSYDPRVMRRSLLEEFKIDLIFDVGANEGQYATEIREFGYTGHIVCFEPLPGAFEKLKSRVSNDPGIELHNVGLGTEQGKSEIHVDGVFSSMLPLNTSHPTPPMWPDKMEKVQTIQIERLDSLSEKTLQRFENSWLKIDVQGFELKVLEGAQKTLEQVRGVEVEVSLSQLYTGQAVMLDVMNFLNRFGFEAIFLNPCFSDLRRGRTLQVDMIFARQNTPVNA